MTTIGQKIWERRKAKGLSQEELAERSRVNLRTIQRIENGENTPRGSTLTMLCEVLQLEMEVLQSKETAPQQKGWHSRIINGIFLIVLNGAMMSVIGFLTLDTGANLNSRIGAILLSICMPLLIVANTQQLHPAKRLLQFGSGFFCYILLAIAIIGFPEAFVTGLVPSLTIALAVLYYGKKPATASST
jgi:transcriptional regulator with XRE-family HTH domain